MDGRLALGLGHQRHAAALFEITHRAERAAFIGRRAGNAENAERTGRRLVRLLDLVAEQGHGTVGEPVEQRCALRIPDRRGVLAHLSLERFPVTHREPHVGQHALEVGGELLPPARVGAVELDIHHRFAPVLVAANRLDRLQLALVVAADADHRVEQPVDRQLALGDGIGDRIHQEGHVVVDDADAHAAVAGLAAGGFDFQREFAALAAGRHLAEELGGFTFGFAAEAMGFARQRVAGQRLSD